MRVGLWAAGSWLLLLAGCRAPTDVTPELAASEPAAELPPLDEAAPATDADVAAGSAGGSPDSEPAAARAAQGSGGERAVCDAEPVTSDELHSGRVKLGASVALGPLLASSQKFLVSEAKSGSCLWGAFAADPERVGARSGVFLVSFGAARVGGAPCAPGADGLPDDLAPGDRLSAQGTLEGYAPAACGAVSPALQLRVNVACPVLREGVGPAPRAAALDFPTAARLAAGTDAALLRDWGGALVRLEAASAVQDPDDHDAVFPFGVLKLEQTPLEVHSRLQYFDLSGAGPRDVAKAWSYPYPSRFESLTGIVFLDYCSWVLAPRDHCADLAPSGRGCGG
jgi:hypothetical protein